MVLQFLLEAPWPCLNRCFLFSNCDWIYWLDDSIDQLVQNDKHETFCTLDLNITKKSKTLHSLCTLLTMVDPRQILFQKPLWHWGFKSNSKKNLSLKKPSSRATILNKNVKKNTPPMFHFRILHSKDRCSQDTSPSPQKKQCWRVTGTFLVRT